MAAVLAALTTAPVAHAAPAAEVLSPLPGDGQSHPTAVNESGSVVGLSQRPGQKAVRWDPGSPVRQLDDLGFGSWANAINRDGLVVGSVTNSANRAEGALWDATGALRVLVVGGADWVKAHDINDRGLITGEAIVNGVTHAVVWDEFRVGKLLDPGVGRFITESGWVIGYADGVPARWTDEGELQSFGEEYSTVLACNEAADAAGHRGREGRLWLGSGAVALGRETWAKDISDTGWAVGRSGTQAYRWKAEEGATGEALSAESSDAVVINNAGTVGGTVGTWAVTWDTNGTQTRLAVPDGAVRTTVRGIAENGQVIGTVSYPGGAGSNVHAVVWR